MIVFSTVKGFATAFALSMTPWLTAPVTAQWGQEPKPTFEEAESQYKAKLKIEALWHRVNGRRQLVRSGDQRIFPILRKDYGDPGDPEQFIRSLMLTMLATDFEAEQPLDSWQRWRQDCDAKEDAWLWYRALRVECAEHAGRWREAFEGRLPVELKAAALAAAADREGGAVLDEEAIGVMMEVSANLSRKSSERSLLLEGLVGLFAKRTDPLDERRRFFLRSLVHTMAEKQTPERCRVVLSRMLARILGRKNIGPVPEDWLELLADAPTEEIELAYARRVAQARPGFFGITEHGRSFAYVIDASDSMLEPLTPRELSDMQPLTGGGTEGQAGGPGRADAAERAIDWKKVKTRFDAARELLKLALRRHTPDQRITVILFGDEASYLQATPGFVAAKEKQIEAACQEVDLIQPGLPRNERPHGTLFGETNMHGGFILAFRAGEKHRRTEPVRRRSYKKKKGKQRPIRDLILLDEKGVDTIYLLSDGKPSADNFTGPAPNRDGFVTDSETGKSREYKGENVLVRGPFTYPPSTVADLRRMNLLQRAAIHAIGLGEADYALLKQIAEIGQGETVRIGGL